MIDKANSISIKRPAEEVFGYVTDITNDPAWHTDILEVRSASPGPIGAGTRYNVEFKPFMGQSEGTMTVASYEPYSRTELHGVMGSMAPKITYTFEPVTEGTRFTRRVQLQPPGLMRLLSPIMAMMIGKQNGQFLQNVKTVLESQATPQTGDLSHRDD